MGLKPQTLKKKDDQQRTPLRNLPTAVSEEDAKRITLLLSSLKSSITITPIATIEWPQQQWRLSTLNNGSIASSHSTQQSIDDRALERGSL